MDFHNSISKRYFLSIVLLACTLVFHPTDAKTLTVGGSLGWTNFDAATSASPDYSTWVSAQPVHVGDVLVFNYAKNFHDVYLLPTKVAFDGCTFATGKSVAPASAGTYSWTAPSVGVFYFSCSFGGEGSSHCQSGQKLAVNVVSPAATSPAAAPLPPPSPAQVPLPPPKADVPVLAPVFVPVASPVPIIIPIPTPTPAPAAPVVPPNVTAPAPAPAKANATAPVPAPATGGATNATNVSSPAPAPVPVVVPVPTPVPAAPVIPVPVPAPTVVKAPTPAPRHAPRPAPHHAPRPAPKHAPHPSPKHSPHRAPAPAPYLGPPAPPLPPSSPDSYTPSIEPSTDTDQSHAGLTSPLEWRSLVLVICLMSAFLVL